MTRRTITKPGYRIDLPDPRQLSEDLVRAVMPRATELVKDRAVKEAPRGRTGNLRAGIEARVEKGGLQGAVASTARHTFLVHEGVKPHRTVVDKKRALKLPSGHLRASAPHPGTRGQPFLTKALEESKPDLERLFRQDGEALLGKAVK
jgi:hypothetical protein